MKPWEKTEALFAEQNLKRGDLVTIGSYLRKWVFSTGYVEKIRGGKSVQLTFHDLEQFRETTFVIFDFGDNENQDHRMNVVNLAFTDANKDLCVLRIVFEQGDAIFISRVALSIVER